MNPIQPNSAERYMDILNVKTREEAYQKVKEIEFDEVVLLIPRNWSNVRSGADNSRQLKYVAMTRAKRVATIVEY
jgi:DNA helicase IV